MILVVFPGQGSQMVGMGKDLYDNFKVARELFLEAEDILRYKLSELVFTGSKEELTRTTNAQPALLTTCIAFVRVLEQESGKNFSSIAHFLAGHSMGQLTALCASDSISFPKALSLVQKRANLMSKSSNGSMLACLGVPLETLIRLVKEAQQHGVCCIANYNSSTQIVLSGSTSAIEFVALKLKEMHYKCVPLKVSGAFHSPLMEDAALEFGNYLESLEFASPKIPVIDNVTATLIDLPSIKKVLKEHLISGVKWMQSIDYFVEKAAEQKQHGNAEVVEIGPGSVLTNLLKKDEKAVKTANISDIETLEAFLSTL